VQARYGRTGEGARHGSILTIRKPARIVPACVSPYAGPAPSPASDGSQKVLASEGLGAPGGFVLGHHHAYITNNSILSDAGQVVKVRL
jgi:hypothetical protein